MVMVRALCVSRVGEQMERTGPFSLFTRNTGGASPKISCSFSGVILAVMLSVMVSKAGNKTSPLVGSTTAAASVLPKMRRRQPNFFVIL